MYLTTFRRSIRNKIIATLLIVGLFPGAIFTFIITFYYMSNAMSSAIGTNFKLIANSSANNVSRIIEERIGEVDSLAHDPGVIRMTEDTDPNAVSDQQSSDIQGYLEWLAKNKTGEYSHIIITDESGLTLANSKKDTQRDYSTERWWTESYNHGNGRRFIGQIDNSDKQKPTIYLASPIISNGQTIGVMGFEITMESLFKDVKKLNVGKNAYINIFDSSGRIMMDRNKVAIEKMDKKQQDELALGKSGWLIAENFQNIRSVIGIAPINIDNTVSSDIFDNITWYVMVPQDLASARKPIYDVVLRIIAIAIFVAFPVILASIYRSMRITEPISDLRRGAKAIAQGDLNYRAVIKTNDEIEDLAHDFNKMVDQLQMSKQNAERINKELEEANRLKSEFLANMSHELRTPLNSIIGFAEILRDQLFGELNEKQQKYVKNVHSSGQHLLQLINDILDLSKIEAGRLELSLQPFPIQKSLNDIMSIVKPLADKKSIAMTLNINPSLNTISADEAKFKQIMYNLLSNAIKFTDDKGSVVIDAVAVKSDVQIAVTDTGVGIHKKNFDRVFGQFQQLDGSESRQHEGTGLGLALTKKLVEMHGGAIWVDSEFGEGSTFTFRIPVAPELPSLGTLAPVESDYEIEVPAIEDFHEKPTILVIEDDPRASEILAVYLDEGGYDVVQAFDGRDAVEKALEAKPFAITLDIMLPNKDGWSVLKELKNNPETADIPVIIISMIDDRELGFSLGAVDHITKPINKQKLLTVLKRKGRKPQKRFRPFVALVVDDDEKSVELVSTILEHEGIGVLKAYDGQSAIDTATQNLPDLIILDLMMPRINGFDVVKELRKHPDAKNIPVIILTSKDITEKDRLALHGHIDKIMEKAKFNKDDLLHEIFKLEKLDPDKALLIDRPTGIYNYRYFKKRFDEESARAARYKRSFSLILVDVSDSDELPVSVNILRTTARLIEENVRYVDPIARYSDDQFILILPETTKEGAIRVGEKIGGLIKNDSKLRTATPNKINSTIGVATYFDDGTESDELLNKLVTAVSRSKQSGRDKLVTC